MPPPIQPSITIPSPGFPPPSNNNSPPFQHDTQDENLHLNSRAPSTTTTTTRGTARKQLDSPSSSEQHNNQGVPVVGVGAIIKGGSNGTTNSSRPTTSGISSNVGIVASAVKNIESNATKAGRNSTPPTEPPASQGQIFTPRSSKIVVGKSPTSTPPTPHSNVSSEMREPVSITNVVDHRNALTPRSSDGSAHIVADHQQPQGRVPLPVEASNNEASAMTLQGWRSRNNSAEQHNMTDAAIKPGIVGATPPRYTQENGRRSGERVIVSTRSSSPSMIPRNPRDTSSAGVSPKYRARQLQQQSFQQPPPQLQPLSRDSQSVQSQASSSVPLPPPSSDWQWGQRNDPDDQEQALFEQRLCEDFYGVAVRKINQNGKSNLRYVKCCLVDVSEIEGEVNGGSSTRSISSRSRGAFSRLRGDRDRSVDRSEPREYDAHRNLIKKGKKKVLTWGKKKDVKLPLDRFVSVRKGKTNDRTRRNASPASRLLSLITDDPQHPSLDIEAPTKLDREKFARAFSRFLDVPLEGDDAHSVRSAEVPQTSTKDRGQAGQVSARGHVFTTNSEPDMDAAVQRNGFHVKANKRPNHPVPMPVVTTAPDGNGAIRADPHRGGSKVPPGAAEAQGRGVGVPSSSLAQMAMEAAALDPNSLNEPDPQISSLPSSTKSLTSHGRANDKRKSSGQDGGSSSGHDADESVVSSLSGAGYDQEIVEELHQALNDLRAELEESRAEAARAVKVAEQAIQSAENSNSRDWNSTVTHKAAEAAALAQKRSAEAMAKQRLAEERLEGERRNTSFWRKQAEAAEEEAGALQTRAAAAAVQRESMAEALESEKRNGSIIVNSLKQRFTASEEQQRQALARSLEKSRSLELELEAMRQQLGQKNGVPGDASKLSPRKRVSLMGRMKKLDASDADSMKLLSTNAVSSSPPYAMQKPSSAKSSLPANELTKLYSEFASLRTEYSLMQKATADELKSLPADAEIWALQASLAVQTSQQEIQRLRSKLAAESATRRKLLHEVQDLRGAVRVYCRPRATAGASTMSMASNEVLLLHRDMSGNKPDSSNFPLSFEFDGIFKPEMGQQDVYDELEDVCLGVVDGYNICMMMYGQKGSGKTYSLLGNVNYTRGGTNKVDVSVDDHGLHLRAMEQLFSVMKHRSERYQDVVTITMVEVANERLCDMLVGTEIGESSGRVIVEDGRGGKRSKAKRPDAPRDETGGPTKLEIKTDINGETVVSGLLSVEISGMEDLHRLWKQCLAKRLVRLAEQGIDIEEHEAASHVITTVKVVSTNVSTGIGSTGKIQFVDLASSDVSGRSSTSGGAKKGSTSDAMMAGFGNEHEWQFTNKSMSTLAEVVTARSQFNRSVPYRNSTLTHLLSDSLEADTKVIMVACISQEMKDMQTTACTLRFASKMRKIVVGKATKHTLTHA